MEYIVLDNGEKIAYRRVGEGKKLLVLHGNFGSSLHFRRLIDNPPAGVELILPDMRGFGESSYNTRITCLKDLALDMVELCAKLGIERLPVLGWSLGGGVAMEMAALAPELVEKLFLMNSTSCYGYPLYNVDDKGKFVPFRSPEEIASNPAVAALLLAQKTGKDQIYRATLTRPFNSKEEEDEFVSCFMAQRNLLDADWALAVFNMTDRPNLYGDGDGRIYDINCPITLTAGDNDKMVPWALVKSNLEAFGSKAKLIMYRDCGHCPLVEKTEQCLADIAAFMA